MKKDMYPLTQDNRTVGDTKHGKTQRSKASFVMQNNINI